MVAPAALSAYAALCAVQGGLVAVPRRRLRLTPRPALALAPTGALVVGVLAIDGTGSGAVWLTVLALVATPALAAFAGWATGSRWPVATAATVAAGYVAAWWTGGAAAQLLQLGLVAAACVTLSTLFAAAVPRRAVAGALVTLAAADCLMVWGLADAGPAASSLHGIELPAMATLSMPSTSPSLQDVTLGPATMGWLDMFAAAALGAILAGSAGRRLAVAAGVAGVAIGWGMLLVVTPAVPATVPVAAALGLIAARHRRRAGRRRAARHSW